MSPAAVAQRPFRWRWYLVPSVLIGLVVGVGGYTFVYAKGGSYLTNDPGRLRQLPRHGGAVRRLDEIQPSLRRGLQRLPHAAGFVGKYATKALNGFWHSFAFTTGRFPSPSGSRRATGRSPRRPAASATDSMMAIDPDRASRRPNDVVRPVPRLGRTPRMTARRSVGHRR